MQEINTAKNITEQNEFTQGYLSQVGELIKQARQSKELTIEDLANSLRIGKEQLIAIESGHPKDLPEKVFIKAMIRRISEKLCLDLSILPEENEKSTEEDKPILSNKENKVKRKIVLCLILIVSASLGTICSVHLIRYITSNNQPVETVTPTFNEL